MVLRTFGDTKSFFNKDRFLRYDNNIFSSVDKLVEYECSMEKRFPFPLNVVCAYEEEDIVFNLDNLELKSLLEHHGVFHKDSIKELVYPLRNSHITLLYDNQQDLNDAYITYINEGLARGQLCVFASVLLQNNDFLRDISPKIINFEENSTK